MTATDTTSTPWPALAWRADALRDLDARSRLEIERAGDLIERAAGERVFAEGDAADTLFVVLSGEVEVRAVRRGDASATLVRRVKAGEIVGEDAVARVASVRTSEAVCISRARLARIPAHVLLRSLTRGGASLDDDPRFRLLRRAALTATMQSMAFARDLSARDVGVLVDAATARTVPRGQSVFAAGDRAREAYFVADGAVQLEVHEGERVRVMAYVGRGDFFGDEEALARVSRSSHAVAAGPTWLLVIPLDAFESVVVRNRQALDAARRVRVATLHFDDDAAATRLGLGDVYRLDIARSLLVIDQDQCVRCGHCATSCADAHGDGVARIVRRGDKVSLTILGDKKSLSLPSSCQHCVQPACMRECPTGAIGRDEKGDVFIREALCTGCGACVKACPWDNVDLAPRGDRMVAVKCDLCATSAKGPACVAACPVEALSRIEPREVVDELRTPDPKRRSDSTQSNASRPAFWAVSSKVLGVLAGALAMFVVLGQTSKTTSGVVLATLTLVLVGYGAIKRTRFVSRLAIHTSMHLALGAIAVGATLAHVSLRVAHGLTGALCVNMFGALATGLFGALVYAVLPRALSRLESKATLPEDLPDLAISAERDLLRELSGKSEGQKALFAKVLDPYRRARAGWVWLAASGRSLKQERVRVGRVVDGIFGKRSTSVDGLIRSVVELRAIDARKWLDRALRGWLPVHIAFVVVATMLAVVHVFVELRYR